MSQLVIDAVGPEPDPEYAQWFTPPPLADKLVWLANDLLICPSRPGPVTILEPSAGSGALISAIHRMCPDDVKITAVEIDKRWIPTLSELAHTVVNADYLTLPPPPVRYDLATSNPPYDGGEEVEHLAKMLDEANRIVALLPGRSLHGKERYRRVWYRFDARTEARVLGPNDWHIRQKVHCILRPAFGEVGGSDEIVLLDMQFHVPGPCRIGWE